MIKLLKRLFKTLPPEGSYIELPVKYQFGTFIWKGIVGHHDDGEHYFIDTGKSTLCAIKP